VDTFSIVKFHPRANGIVNTVESRFPKAIKTDQPWIGENALGDWFYSPGFVYSAPALILTCLRWSRRDGSYAVNIPIRPDGSLDPDCLKMLREVGAWMKINGEGIYGSKAWVKLGEGARRCGRQPARTCLTARSPGARRLSSSAPRTFASPWARTARSTLLRWPRPNPVRKSRSPRSAAARFARRSHPLGHDAGQPEEARLEPEAGRPGDRLSILDALRDRRRLQGSIAKSWACITLVARGLSNREIALHLFVSENTVKTHCARAFDKLGAARRTQAVQRGKELGLLP
jgi:hypothetical protein